MASDDVKKNEGKDPATRADEAADRAKAAAKDAQAADKKAADAARQAEYDADHSSDQAVHEAAHEAAAKATEAHEAEKDAKQAADEAGEAAEKAAGAAESGDHAAAESAADGAEAAANRAEQDAKKAAEAAGASADAEERADQAKIAADDRRGYGEEHVEERSVHKERRPALLLAEFETVESCMRAAERVRDAGYERWDVHTPYPVHGMEKAMGLPETRLGWISMVAAMIGLGTAVLMIHYMNASTWDLAGFQGYPIVVGGKPPASFPSMVPIMFELTILLTGFGTLLGMLHLIKLPKHHHPIFESARFAAASDDKFFISIETADPKFEAAETRRLLESTDPTHLEVVEEEVP